MKELPPLLFSWLMRISLSCENIIQRRIASKFIYNAVKNYKLNSTQLYIFKLYTVEPYSQMLKQ